MKRISLTIREYILYLKPSACTLERILGSSAFSWGNFRKPSAILCTGRTNCYPLQPKHRNCNESDIAMQVETEHLARQETTIIIKILPAVEIKCIVIRENDSEIIFYQSANRSVGSGRPNLYNVLLRIKMFEVFFIG